MGALFIAMTVGSLRMMPLAARVHERVRGAEVDREVAGQGGAYSLRPAAGLDATGTDVVRALAPVGAARPVLALPDRHRLLERVDAEAGGLEGLGPVRRRHHDRDRRLRELEVADAVQQREALDDRPAPPALRRRPRRARRRASSS